MNTILNKDTSSNNILNNYKIGEVISLKFIIINKNIYKEDNCFGSYICDLMDNDNYDNFNVIGKFTNDLTINQSYFAVGKIENYRGNRQFDIKNIKKIIPDTKKGIIAFLQSLSNMKYFVDLIYNEYGNESINYILNKPQEVLKLSPAIDNDLINGWKEEINNLNNNINYIQNLINIGLTAIQAKKLYDKYGNNLFLKLKSEPYMLTRECNYSFAKCDNIALNLGTDPCDLVRLTEGIYSLFDLLALTGDTYFLYEDFVKLAKDKLSIKLKISELKKIYKNLLGNNPYKYKKGKIDINIPQQKIFNVLEEYKNAYTKKQREKCTLTIYKINEENIKKAINILIKNKRVIISDNNHVYKKSTYDYECQIATDIFTIMSSTAKTNINTDDLINNYLKTNKIYLEEKQYEATKVILSEFGGVLIITGPAGCGKTFCMKTALTLLEKVYMQKHNYFEKVIIAPTGKASKIAEQSTGIPSYTIHRILGYNPTKGYIYNYANKLPYDCIVIDEASMLDTDLTYHLFSAISSNTKVIIMGDTEQLPSIGSGNVLKDLINSKKIKCITFDTIKRQKLDSGIIINANNILNGKMITSQKSKMDALVYKSENADEVYKRLFKVYKFLLNKYPLNEIQILSPQKTGECGTNYLNYLIQLHINPNNNEIRFLNKQFDAKINNKIFKFDLFFKKNDKVINVQNNYKIPCYKNENNKLVLDTEHCGIMNGETGTIVKLIQKENEYGERTQWIVVQFDDKFIIYENDFSTLEHAYALTIHKSQGSEWDAVILILYNNNKFMINKNLLYTGSTRAKSFIATITALDEIKYAISNNYNTKRKTGLKNRLIQYINFKN